MPNTPFTPEQIAQILEAFFDAVGTRQYIGARYVPLFGRKGEDSIEWDNTGTYEPLTIVLYQGNSYTSRQFVPVGVEITNQDFWAITGNYNAQIEQYRRETAAAAEAAAAAQADIDGLLPKTAFSLELTVKDYIDRVQNDIDTLLPKSAFSAENTVKDYIESYTETIADRISYWFTPEDYGAIGDGVTDDTEAIQAAINAAVASETPFVRFTNNYRITDQITINGACCLYGPVVQEYLPTIYIDFETESTAFNVLHSSLCVTNLCFKPTEQYQWVSSCFEITPQGADVDCWLRFVKFFYFDKCVIAHGRIHTSVGMFVALATERTCVETFSLLIHEVPVRVRIQHFAVGLLKWYLFESSG